MSSLREVYDQGYRRVCIACNTVFKSSRVPSEAYETGHGYEENLEMCRCGCDLIGYIIEKNGELEISRTESGK